jgi:predicted phage terminase large subunit-like protein
MKWSVVYKSAINPDGSLFFPERLSAEFLQAQKQNLGSYSFANQYMNEIIPEELQTFKKHWLKYYTVLPSVPLFHFAFIDPAIGQKKTSDYTGIVVIAVDPDTNWYVRVARRERMTPSQIVNTCFDIQKEYSCLGIGVESVAYQEALIYMLNEETMRRQIMLPIKAFVPPTDRTKEARIRGLVPRYEWGRVYHCQGLYDLETELLQFPRGSHDDIVNGLADLDGLITYPERERENVEKPNSASDPRYERWFINQRLKQASKNQG